MQGRQPLLIMSTRMGTPYNLTPTNRPKLKAIQLAAGDFLHLKPILKALPPQLTFKKFIGQTQDVLTYLTPYDCGRKQCMNGTKGEQIKMMANKGYQEVTSYEYYELVELIKPDMWVAMTEVPHLMKDAVADSTNSFKRAIGKTTNFLRSMRNIEQMKGELLAPIHGGKNQAMLQRSLDQCLRTENPISGIVVMGLCRGESLEEREEIVKKVLDTVKKFEEQTGKKLRLGLSGEGSIEDIQHGFKLGFDLFEVSYPFRLAQEEKALIYDSGMYVVRKPQLKPTLQPLDKSCKCSTCRGYSASYVSHLTICHEMTAKVLLSVHNLHQYLNEFQK